MDNTYTWGDITDPDTNAIIGYWCKIARYNGMYYGAVPSYTPFYGYGDTREEATAEAERKLSEDAARPRDIVGGDVEIWA